MTDVEIFLKSAILLYYMNFRSDMDPVVLVNTVVVTE